MGTAERATITYKNLPQDVKPGDSILLDDGLIGLKVEEVQGDTEIVCTVMNDGPISNHKGVNVPGVKLNLPSSMRRITQISFTLAKRASISSQLPS